MLTLDDIDRMEKQAHEAMKIAHQNYMQQLEAIALMRRGYHTAYTTTEFPFIKKAD